MPCLTTRLAAVRRHDEEANLDHIAAGSLRSAAAGFVAGPAGAVMYEIPGREVVAVPVSSLLPGETPRLGGEDKAHVALLAEAETPLPPILVDRRSMRVIDGMHRLPAASSKGRETIDVEFFDGSAADAFLCSVEANVTHGFPLSQADRRAAAARIIASHPHMSDRAIAESVGLAAKTVAAIRRSTDAPPEMNARVGRDGRVRPLDGVAGRRRAADLLAEHPGASLREIARGAGVSPTTARDVRRRLERGEEPSLGRPRAAEACGSSARPRQAGQGRGARQEWCSRPRPLRWRSCCGIRRCATMIRDGGCCGCCSTMRPGSRSGPA
jgi:ParB-like chromosome segregation protein Spo0J